MIKINPIFDFSSYLEEGEKIKQVTNIDGIINVEPYYYITSKGRVFTNAPRYHRIPKEMTPSRTSGYATLKLASPTGVPQPVRLDRLMLYYFEGVPENVREMEANHKDGNTLNDNISNLEWVTHQENMIHAGRMGLMGNSVTDQVVSDIIDDLLSEKYTLKEIALRNDTTESVVQNIKANKTYMHVRPQDRVFSKQKHLLSSEIVSIYNESAIKIDDKGLAEKYGVSETTIQAIRTVIYPYNLTLGDVPPILTDNVKFSDEEALEIYNDCKARRMTIGQIAAKYNVGKGIINDIKFLRHSYEHLKDKYNIEPLEYDKNVRKALTPQEIMNIRNMLLSGKKVAEVAKIFNTSESTIHKIKRGEY